MQLDARVSTTSSHRRGQGRHYEELTLVRPPLNALGERAFISESPRSSCGALI